MLHEILHEILNESLREKERRAHLRECTDAAVHAAFRKGQAKESEGKKARYQP